MNGGKRKKKKNFYRKTKLDTKLQQEEKIKS